MLLLCKICHKPFEWERNGTGGRQPTICLSAECRKIRDHQCYLKWKAAHPYTRYEKNKKKAEKLQAYESKDVPKTQQWLCQRCGEMSSNRINCPACLKILTNSCSMEHPAFIYNQSNEDKTSPPPG